MVYEAYGLTITSDIELPELTISEAAGAGSDICINIASPIAIPEAHGKPEYIALGETPALLYLADRGRFRVSNGNRIEFDPEPNVDAKTLRLFLLGPALSLILHQRDFLVLHASGVCFAGSGVAPIAAAFLGDSGEGKSTMAATLYERGHRAMADDIIPVPDPLAVGTPDRMPVVPSGFPMFKLWPPSVEALYEETTGIPLLLPNSPEYPRREKRADREFERTAVPLGAVFVLETGPEIRCERLTAHAALMALIRNSYWVAELPPDQRERHFRQCSALVARVAVFRLQRPRDLSRLPEVAACVEAVVEDFRAGVNGWQSCVAGDGA
jgi:hypothetical protein